jgi:polysaccharide biosynthesis protein PslJ
VRGLAPPLQRPAALSILGAFALLSVGVMSGHGAKVLAPLLALVAVVAAARRTFIAWDRVIALIVLVVFFVPIGRYTLPGNLPFDLELYRLVIAVCVLVWVGSLLVDSRVRVIGTAFDRPLLLIAGCVLASEITNPRRVVHLDSSVIKALSVFASFLLIYYLTATTVLRRETVEFLLKLMTVCGAVVGGFGIIELRTHYNVFDHLHSVLPFLHYEGNINYLLLGGNLRVLGSAVQSIALGALLVLLLPLAIYFARKSGRRWWIAALFLLLGTFASGSRTAIVMLVVEIVVFLVLKPKETKRFWPALVPMAVLVHVALPGVIGGFRESFFPKGGLIAQQSRFEPGYNRLLAGGRVSLFVPMLKQASSTPLFGEGYGTRIVGFNVADRNAPILDDQWLDNVLDVGFIGLAAWIWLMVRAVRRLARASRASADPDDDWLFTSLAASIASFAVGMFVFDAFGFVQVTIVFWILLSLSAVLLRIAGFWPAVPSRRPVTGGGLQAVPGVVNWNRETGALRRTGGPVEVPAGSIAERTTGPPPASTLSHRQRSGQGSSTASAPSR